MPVRDIAFNQYISKQWLYNIYDDVLFYNIFHNLFQSWLDRAWVSSMFIIVKSSFINSS